jgi:hypothetical protein
MKPINFCPTPFFLLTRHLAIMKKGRCEKIGIIPLTLPSPSRGEGEDNEITKKFPSPLRGEGLGGGDNEIFSHLQGDDGGFDTASSG